MKLSSNKRFQSVALTHADETRADSQAFGWTVPPNRELRQVDGSIQKAKYRFKQDKLLVVKAIYVVVVIIVQCIL